jgi:hypothetical protein
LDEVFGVTNNKQAAVRFGDMAGKSKSDIAAEAQMEPGELERAWAEEGDPGAGLLPLLNAISNGWNRLYKELENRGGREAARRHDVTDRNSAERRGTAAVRKRVDAGHGGETASDREEMKPAEVRKMELQSGLEESGLTPEEAKPQAAAIVDTGLKFVFTHKPVQTDAFFDVTSKAGTLMVNLNTEHPVYGNLLKMLEMDSGQGGASKQVTQVADVGFKLLMEAWARMEDENEGRRRDDMRRIREQWGYVCRDFLGDE